MRYRGARHGCCCTRWKPLAIGVSDITMQLPYPRLKRAISSWKSHDEDDEAALACQVWSVDLAAAEF